MNQAKRLWRTLLFFILLAALCGSFALPTIYIPAYAAPKLQATSCSGIQIAGWTFTGNSLAPTPAGSGVFSNGTGLSGPTFPVGQVSSESPAISFSGWTTNSTADPQDYIQLQISTLGTSSISFSFDSRISSTGPATFQVNYSTDGTTFTAFGLPTSSDIGQSWDHQVFDLSSISSLNNAPNIFIRLYGYSATQGNGTWRLDNIIFCGSPLVKIDSIVPNPTNSGTTVTWHSLVNGNFEIRLGSTNCTDGTLVDSGAYTTSPNTVSFSINGSVLIEGINTIRVCLTDSSGNAASAVGSVTKDSTAPTVTVNQAAGQTDPANTTPINFTVVFSEPINPSTFTPSDITQNGTASPVTWTITDSGDHTNFTLSVTSVLQNNRTLIPSIAANQITDSVGNGNIASTSVDNTVTFLDNISPAVTINQSPAQADPTAILPIRFEVVFSEPINTSSFTATDITQTGSATGITWIITDSGDHKNFTLQATAVTGAGVLIPTIAAGTVTDLAGNNNTASTSTDNSVTYNNSVSTTSVVISEFRTRGPDGANDEFIELYNPTANAINIGGWKINASDKAGTSKTTKATIPLSTLLQSGQYYLIINNNSSGGYSNASVAGNLTYGTGIADDGGIALLKADDTVVDQVGMSPTSAYKEGTTLAPLTVNVDESYERKLGGTSDSCQDTNNNANDFSNITPSRPQNYATPLRRCGTLLSLRSSFTTITSDLPDPSLVNYNVTVSVKVTGGSPTPTGKVSITVTGATITCIATLNSSGTGSCGMKFTTVGTKTIVATYLGDSTHVGSLYTTSHYVSTSIINYPTPIPAVPPPPPLLGINEFVPRPGHDWNHDGVVNTGDEYIELLNFGVVNVNLSGWRLDDEVNVGSNPYSLPAKVLKPGERIVFFGSETGLLLGDGGDAVRLLKANGQLADAYNYSVVRYPDESYCRLPDNGGLDDWNQYCFPTPGFQNSLSGNFVPPTIGNSEQPSCPIADTLPDDFVQAECDPFGNNIWRPEFWDRTGWYDEKNLPSIDGKWPVFAD